MRIAVLTLLLLFVSTSTFAKNEFCIKAYWEAKEYANAGTGYLWSQYDKGLISYEDYADNLNNIVQLTRLSIADLRRLTYSGPEAECSYMAQDVVNIVNRILLPYR